MGSRETVGDSQLGEERGLEDECEGRSSEEIFLAGEQDGGVGWWGTCRWRTLPLEGVLGVTLRLGMSARDNESTLRLVCRGSLWSLNVY